jgi:hypothetical protein
MVQNGHGESSAQTVVTGYRNPASIINCLNMRQPSRPVQLSVSQWTAELALGFSVLLMCVQQEAFSRISADWTLRRSFRLAGHCAVFCATISRHCCHSCHHCHIATIDLT